MGIFDWLFGKSKLDIKTADGLNIFYDKNGSIRCQFFKKNGLLDGEYIEYQGKRILIKGQFKDNLLDGEWTLWAWNNDRAEPGCTEVWSNGQLKSIEVFYDYFLKINMKGKYINQGKKSIIAGELCYYSGLKIENITRSNKI